MSIKTLPQDIGRDRPETNRGDG